MLTLELNNGVVVPQIGFGTYKITDDDAEAAVASALGAGYRRIDTAQMYRNEAGVGRGIAASGLPREDVFVTTKLNNANHHFDVALASFAASLDALRLDYVDLFQIGRAHV
jgi:2,5-diketo-D-gluconate reductase A